jgi:hypothetical protein
VSYFGFNPRRCFDVSLSHKNLLDSQQDVQNKVYAIQGTTLTDLFHQTLTQRGISHSVFQLSPEDAHRFLNKCHIEAVSKWALNLVLAWYESRKADAAAEFYENLAGLTNAASLRGRIFERQVLKYFDSIQVPRLFSIRSLKGSTTVQWTHPGSAERNTFQSGSFTSSLVAAVNGQKPVHLVPADPNFPAIDSVIYDPANFLTHIQVTLNLEHQIVVEGLQRVQKWLPLNSNLAHLRPSVTAGKHWCLLFVVPITLEPDFPHQNFKGDTGTQEWSKKVDQYVLGIAENSIWGRTLHRQ